MERAVRQEQEVGREFVRQYYTLLHEAPDQLHRFYSHNSCFVHGGMERPGEEQPAVTGQEAIHAQIKELGFSNCYAKIRQVDSQITVSNAVVVQVTGELSNNGQPLRRFMQTFVLAAQSTNKFYVQNDIFRYQDEVFDDEDEVEEERQQEHEDSYQEQVSEPSYSDGLGNERDSAEQSVAENVVLNEESVCPEPEIEQPEEEVNAEEDILEASEQLSPQQQQEDAPPKHLQGPPKPLSWSQRVQANGPSNHVAESRVEKPRVQQVRERPAAPQEDTWYFTDSPSAPPKQGEFASRSTQLFIGNVPHDISEEDLRKHFSMWGTVTDTKIHRKAQNTPYYGFVEFKDPETVKAVLDDPKARQFQGRHRLNIEEKKARPTGKSGYRGRGRGAFQPRQERY